MAATPQARRPEPRKPIKAQGAVATIMRMPGVAAGLVGAFGPGLKLGNALFNLSSLPAMLTALAAGSAVVVAGGVIGGLAGQRIGAWLEKGMPRPGAPDTAEAIGAATLGTALAAAGAFTFWWATPMYPLVAVPAALAFGVLGALGGAELVARWRD